MDMLKELFPSMGETGLGLKKMFGGMLGAGLIGGTVGAVGASAIGGMRTAGSNFANKIRIGEYLKHIGLIDVDQLQNAMRIQKESEESNEKKGFASILVDLGLVTRDDTDNILLIKQESRRRFTLNFNSSSADENPNGTNSPVSLQSLEEKRQLDKLEYENKLLKAKLRQLLNVDKK